MQVSVHPHKEMMDMKWNQINWKHTGLFAAGVLFGTAGIKALASKDAKKVYTECTAAVLRAKKCVMDTVTTVQENAEDIYAEAKDINAKREAEEEAAVYEDAAQECPLLHFLCNRKFLLGNRKILSPKKCDPRGCDFARKRNENMLQSRMIHGNRMEDRDEILDQT